MNRTTLQIESLEPRLPMVAGISATLNGNVLTIAGSDASDTITLEYSKTALTIVDLNQTFQRRDLKLVEIIAGAGDDTVELHYTGPKKPKWFGVAFSLNAEGGNDTLIDALDQPYYFGGTGSLDISRKGKLTVGGEKLGWFDTNVPDSDVRAAAKSSYHDKVLSRDDMLALFATTTADDVLTTFESESLKAIVANESLFRKLDDVYALSNYVVHGAPKSPQLGHVVSPLMVAAESDAAVLESQVDKWFLGKDRPVAKDIDTGAVYEYRETAGTLFVAGPSYEDIRQGNIGDCYFLAGLGAIAVHSPKPITNMFIDNGDGTYTVRFFAGEQTFYITVDTYLPVDQWGRLVFASAGVAHDNPANELWVALAEKAYAQFAELGWLGTGGTPANSYAAIHAGWPADAVEQISGKAAFALLQLLDFKDVTKAFAKNRPVTFITPTAPASADIVENHVYVMIGYDAKNGMIELFNPWGVDNPHKPGIVVMQWDEILQNFYAWDFGAKV